MMRTSHYDLISDDTKDYLESKQTPWTTHPRPQMKRDLYQSLNGKWLLDGKDIVVPFAPQSSLANFKGKINEEMTYEKVFMVPEHFTKECIQLHFGAVDQICDVYLSELY